MSRWKSPQAADRQAKCAARETEKLRKEKHKNLLIVTGIILLMLTIWAAYIVFYAIPCLQNPASLGVSVKLCIGPLKRK